PHRELGVRLAGRRKKLFSVMNGFGNRGLNIPGAVIYPVGAVGKPAGETYMAESSHYRCGAWPGNTLIFRDEPEVASLIPESIIGHRLDGEYDFQVFWISH